MCVWSLYVLELKSFEQQLKLVNELDINFVLKLTCPQINSPRPNAAQIPHWTESNGAVENHWPPNWTINTWETRVVIQIVQKMGFENNPLKMFLSPENEEWGKLEIGRF